MRKSIWIILFVFVWGISTSLAQECPDYVAETLATVADECNAIARNQACYGNTQLSIETDVVGLEFDSIGDIVDMDAILSMRLSGADSGDWAVALLNLQANLPATLPGQNVTVLLFGDVELQAVDDSLQAFYFTGGIGQPNCAEAPNGILLQSPAGETASININGAEVQFGSTIFLQNNEGSLSLNTFAGLASVSSAGETQLVPQGTRSNLALDDDGMVDAAASYPESLAAQDLEAFAVVLNQSGTILPTYEDAAASPRIQALVAQGLITVLDATTPIIALDDAAIPVVIAALEAQVIPISSGHWRLAEQSHEVIGTCIDPTTGGVGSGGGVGDGEEYTTPICASEDNSALIFGTNPIDALALNVYGDEYTSVQPNFGRGEGEVTVTNRWEYQVISPTRIEMTFTSAEEGGCTLTSVFVYELKTEDAEACAEDTWESSSSGSFDMAAQDYTGIAVESGAYRSNDLYVLQCTDNEIADAFANLTLAVGEESLVLSVAETDFTLPSLGPVYMMYDGTLTVAVTAIDSATLSISYMNGSCMAFGTFQVEN